MQRLSQMFLLKAIRPVRLQKTKSFVAFQSHQPGLAYQTRIYTFKKPTSKRFEKEITLDDIEDLRVNQGVPQAIELAEKLLKQQESSGAQEFEATTHFYLSNLFFSFGTMEYALKAVSHLITASKLAKEHNQLRNYQHCITQLAEIYLRGFEVPNIVRSLEECLKQFNEEDPKENWNKIIQMLIYLSRIQRDKCDFSPRSFEKEISARISAMKPSTITLEDNNEQTEQEAIEQDEVEQMFQILIEVQSDIFQLELDRRNLESALNKLNLMFNNPYFNSLPEEFASFFVESVKVKLLFEYYYLTNQKEPLEKILKGNEEILTQISKIDFVLYLTRKVRFQLKFGEIKDIDLALNDLIKYETIEMGIDSFDITSIFHKQYQTQFDILKRDPIKARKSLQDYYERIGDLIVRPLRLIELNSIEADVLELEGKYKEANYCLQTSIDKHSKLLGENSEQIKRLELQQLNLRIEQMLQSTEGVSITTLQEIETKVHACLKVIKEKKTYGNRLELQVEQSLERLASLAKAKK